mgnify:FL=1
MKDEKKKNIKMIAEEIARLEKSYQSKNNVSESLNKLEQIIQTLSLEEMLEIDEYILKEKLLTK